ncbi:hypothetical protein JOD43_000750 [Pullulanibacillus pueri]|uniref:Uncharacterized protein n=1 Tax=Pullulanibacillus pueri TaxID=1437324 RepID=A0A8J3EMU4_9BACL|nr:hypothetical protein [Pullulanibacillus pueri]MBM7680588.1 hypothetical protein [Pullulanibacillus pueri]GGH84010.1 hypothetical protein GCM10007096_26100 [Pullulanibacillus pueri]
MKQKVHGKKRREALKKWLKERLGSWKPQQKQSPTSSSQTKSVA